MAFRSLYAESHTMPWSDRSKALYLSLPYMFVWTQHVCSNFEQFGSDLSKSWLRLISVLGAEYGHKNTMLLGSISINPVVVLTIQQSRRSHCIRQVFPGYCLIQ